MSYYFNHYKINWGDNIESIANKFNVSPHELYFKYNEDFFVGQVVNVPVYYSEQKVISENRTLEYYLKRQMSKRRYFKFYK